MAPEPKEAATTAIAATVVANSGAGRCSGLQRGAANPFWAFARSGLATVMAHGRSRAAVRQDSTRSSPKLAGTLAPTRQGGYDGGGCVAQGGPWRAGIVGRGWCGGGARQ